MNFKNKNANPEMENSSITKYYNDKIDNLWSNEIWKNNKFNTHIKNKQVNDFFNKLKNIEKEYNGEQVKFSIGINYDVMIEDNKKKNKKKIANFKKDNLMMLKIHSDCFIEYHNIVFDYLNKKNNLLYYNLDVMYDIVQENRIETKLILDDNLIREQIICFKDEFVEYKNNYNLNDIINTLELNIFKIKEILLDFIDNINPLEPILLIDVENILKSYEIQNFLKSHIDEEKFNKYFYTWNNGYFNDSNNIETINNESITLSEYSSKVKYVEPFTSLNLSVEKKLKLIKIINDKLIKNTNTINILTSNLKSTKITVTQEINSKLISGAHQRNTDISFGCNEISKIIHSSNKSETSTQSNYKTNSNLFIPIQYNDKFDIREQDDHLLVLIYMILKKNNLNPIIISNDKFKWFKSFDTLEIKNFKTLYDYDLGEKKIIIDITYTPPIYKINSNYYMFPFINYPQLEDNISQDITSIINIDELKKIFKTKIKKVSLLDIKNIYTYLFNFSILETNIETNQEFTSIINFCLNYLEHIKDKFNKINNFLSSNSKEKIFKISIEENSNIFDRHEIKNYLILMENYKIFVEIYIMIKFVVFKNYSKTDFISILFVDLCKIFDLIIEIYDLFDTHIYKIRKLSGSKSELDELFKKINTIYIYIRKCGYFKKNIY